MVNLSRVLSQDVPRIGIVIPTKGDRSRYFAECATSIRRAGNAFLCVVCPSQSIEELRTLAPDVDKWVSESGTGPADAINEGIRALPQELEYVAWLGDDDLLEPDSVESTLSEFSDGVSFVFGQCRYIDPSGEPLFVNAAGRFATRLIRFGPNLIPQPGSVIRRSDWEKVGGLDPKLKWTFDLDLFLRLLAVGKGRHTNHVVSSFRWHADSLTAGQRRGSVKEASDVRRSHIRGPFKPLSLMWEPFMRFCILHAGSLVTLRSRRKFQGG